MEVPVREKKTWDSKKYTFTVSKEIINDVLLSLSYQNSNVKGYDSDENYSYYYLNKFSPNYIHGKQNSIILKIEMRH